MNRSFLVAAAFLFPACVLDTQPVRGTKGEPGVPGPAGDSPFSYAENMSDIYFDEGSVAIGATGVGQNYDFFPVLDVSGTRGALTLRTTEPSGIATLRFTGPSDDLVDDWHINMYAGKSSTLTIAPRAGKNAIIVNNDGAVGVGVLDPGVARLTVGGADEAGVAAVIRLKNENPGGADAFVAASDDTWAAGPNKLLLGVGGPINTNGVKMTVDDQGNVGIGTTAPAAKLEVHGGPGVVVTIGGDIPETALKIYGDSWVSCQTKACPLSGQDGWLKVRVGGTDHYMPLFP